MAPLVNHLPYDKFIQKYLRKKSRTTPDRKFDERKQSKNDCGDKGKDRRSENRADDAFVMHLNLCVQLKNSTNFFACKSF